MMLALPLKSLMVEPDSAADTKDTPMKMSRMVRVVRRERDAEPLCVYGDTRRVEEGPTESEVTGPAKVGKSMGFGGEGWRRGAALVSVINIVVNRGDGARNASGSDGLSSQESSAIEVTKIVSCRL